MAVTGLATVLLLVAVLVVAPRSSPGPAASSGLAGYPAERALTTEEFAALMSGPTLPVNTALVASVTIDARTDVCPMNRYPTLGVVELPSSQVCVMGAGVSDYLNVPSESGVFAFRYLANGVLGLIGQVTPPSSPSAGLAFHVADEWPLAGRTFLVDGWLGAVGLTNSCASLSPAGDVLNPSGEDCPDDNWLGDDPTAPGIVADHEYWSGSPAPSYDPLALRGNARHVEAGGMRQIDGIDHSAAVHSVYVVRSVVGGCPGAPVSSSTGCATWRVLARLGDLTLLQSTASAAVTGTVAPPATPVVAGLSATGFMGSGNRPMTVAEFQAAWTGDPDHLAGRIVITKGPVPASFGCWSAGAADASAPPGACQLAVSQQQIAPEGYWAVRVGGDGRMELLGPISTPNSQFVVKVGDNNTAGPLDELRMVDGWLEYGPGDGCDVNPQPTTGHVVCLDSHLTGMPGATAFWEILQNDAYRTFGSTDINAGPIHGLWLVHVCTACRFDEILARLSPVG